MLKYSVELTDTFAGEANYAWVKRATIYMPELTHYGYDGCTNYAAANKIFERELMRKAKAAVGIAGRRGVKSSWGSMIEFRLPSACMVMFVAPAD